MREEKGKACSVEDSACHLLKFLKKVFQGKCGKFIITSYKQRNKRIANTNEFVLELRAVLDHFKVHRQHVPRQNVPKNKTSQGTKRPKKQNVLRKKGKGKGKNVPGDITSQGQNVPRKKLSKGLNVTHQLPSFQKHILC